MMTAASFGKGQIFFVNLPLEQQSVENGGCFHGENLNPLYLLYREAAERAGIRRLVKTELPGVGITEHPLENGKTVCVAINYEPEEAICGAPVRELKNRICKIPVPIVNCNGLKGTGCGRFVFSSLR